MILSRCLCWGCPSPVFSHLHEHLLPQPLYLKCLSVRCLSPGIQPHDKSCDYVYIRLPWHVTLLKEASHTLSKLPIFLILLTFFFLHDVPLIHQCFLCLNDETPCLVDNLRNSLDLTTNKEVLHESLSTAEWFYFIKKKKAENKLCSLQPKCLETFYGRGRH